MGTSLSKNTAKFINKECPLIIRPPTVIITEMSQSQQKIEINIDNDNININKNKLIKTINEIPSNQTCRKFKNNNKKGLINNGIGIILNGSNNSGGGGSGGGSGGGKNSDLLLLSTYEKRRKNYEQFIQELKHKGLLRLSGEIDRCLKKVSEGVETFEDIWQKVHNATNTNQKEKYETDLKKEIKKLQRLRDQIKSWIASGEIKDKSTLVDTRKLIETQMERFKVVERETKTKAYSKEGLGATQKLDPTTREREDLNNWLVSSIDQMQIQMDQYESEIESIMAGKKKRLDKEKQDRLDELKIFMERHKFHMSKLETLMRMLDNLAVDVNLRLREFLTQVKKIKDDIEYYLESSQDAEFEENEFLYDDIEGLEEQQALGNLALNIGGELELTGGGVGGDGGCVGVGVSGGTPTSITSGNISPISPIHSSDSSSDPEKRRKSSDDSSNQMLRPLPIKLNPTTVDISPSNKTNIPTIETFNNLTTNTTLNHHLTTISSISSYQNVLNNVKSITTEEIKNNLQISTTSSPLDTSSIIYNSITNCLIHSTSTFPIDLQQNNSEIFNGLNNIHDNCNFDNNEIERGTTTIGTTDPSLLQPTTTTTTTISPNKNYFTLIEENGLEVGEEDVDVDDEEEEEEDEEEEEEEEYSTDTFIIPTTTIQQQQQQSTVVVVQPSQSTCIDSIMNHLNIGNEKITTIFSNPNLIDDCNEEMDENNCINDDDDDVDDDDQQQIINQQQQQQQQQQQMSPSSVLDYIRIPERLIGRYLNESGDTITLKSIAQDAIDRAGISLTEYVTLRTTEANIPPLLGVAPLGPVPLQKEHQYQLQMLEAAHLHLPVSADSERMRQFLPRNPIPAPSYYPQHPLTNSDSLEFFQRLSIETLFFIFYYLEGTKAQYLAAKVLKKQSWRFHTKYMMWFQRHEEPKVINEDYEQGTYIYFDIEKWGQRKKDGFVFEYRYLEDRELS